MIAGYAADITKTCDPRFKMPDDIDNHCILSVHYYTPKTFCRASIQNYWGNKSEQKWMEHQINDLRTTFIDNGIPVIITEYGAKGSDEASRVFFCEMLTKLCRDNYISTFLWDDGSEFDRTSFTWHTPELINALKRATSGNSYVPEKPENIDEQTREAKPTSETSEHDNEPAEPESTEEHTTTEETADIPPETFQSLTG